MPVAQLRDGALQPTHARLVLLRVGDQADPLVAGEGSDVEPSLHRGVVADERGRVRREDGGVIEGLYALGNTAANAFGAVYPGAGATIAQGLVYGYIAGRDAAGQL